MAVQTGSIFCDPSKLTISGHRVGSASIHPLKCNPRAAELSHMIGALTKDVYFSDWLRKTAGVQPDQLHNYAFDLAIESDRAEFTVNGASYRFAGLLEANEGEIAAHLSSRVSRSLTECNYDLTQRKQAHVQREHFIPIILEAEKIFSPPVTSVGFQATQEPTPIPVVSDPSAELAAIRELFTQLSAQQSTDHKASLAAIKRSHTEALQTQSADHRANLDTIARGHEVSTRAMERSHSEALQAQSADHQHTINHLMKLIGDFQKHQEASQADVVGQLVEARRELAQLKEKLLGFEETKAENVQLKAQLSDAQNTLTTVQSALAAKEKECEGLQQEQNLLQDELSTLKAAQANLEGALKKAQSDQTQSLKEVEALASQFEASKSKSAALERQISQIDAKLSAAEANSQAQAAALIEAQLGEEHLKAELAASQLAIEGALTAQEALGSELDEAKRSAKALEERLQQETQAFTERLEQAQATIESQAGKLQTLSAAKEKSALHVRDLSNELEEAKAAIRELEAELKAKERHYAEADATITKQEQQISGQKAEIESLRAELTKEKDRVAHLEKALAQAKASYSDLEDNFDALHIQFKEQELLIQELRKPGVDFDAMLEKATSALARRHDAEIKGLTDKIEAQEGTIEALEADHKLALTKISQDLAKAQEELTAAQRESDTFSDAYTESEAHRISSIRNAVKAVTEELEGRVDELTKERDALKANFDQSIREAHVFTQDLLAEKDQTIQTHEEQIAALEAEKASLNERLTDAISIAKEQFTDYSLLKEQYDELITTSGIVTEGLSDYRSEIENLHAELADTSEREEALRLQLAEHESLIALQEQSIRENAAYIQDLEERPFESAHLPEGYNAEQMSSYMAERAALIKEHIATLDENNQLLDEKFKALEKARESEAKAQSFAKELSSVNQQLELKGAELDLSKKALRLEAEKYHELTQQNLQARRDIIEMRGLILSLSDDVHENQAARARATEELEEAQITLEEAETEIKGQRGRIQSLEQRLSYSEQSAAEAIEELKSVTIEYRAIEEAHSASKAAYQLLEEAHSKRLAEVESAESKAQALRKKETEYQAKIAALQEQHQELLAENEELHGVHTELKATKALLTKAEEAAQTSTDERAHEYADVEAELRALTKKVRSQQQELAALSEEKEMATKEAEAARASLAQFEADRAKYDEDQEKIQQLESLVSALIKVSSGAPQEKKSAQEQLERSTLMREIATKLETPATALV